MLPYIIKEETSSSILMFSFLYLNYPNTAYKLKMNDLFLLWNILEKKSNVFSLQIMNLIQFFVSFCLLFVSWFWFFGQSVIVYWEFKLNQTYCTFFYQYSSLKKISKSVVSAAFFSPYLTQWCCLACGFSLSLNQDE